MRLLPSLFLLLTLTACGEGRWAPGYIVTSDGQMLSNNDENTRAVTIATIVANLSKDLGPHWRVEAAIAELPVYDASGLDGGRATNTGWLWPKATTTITLIGDGVVPLPVAEAEITRAVRDYLYRQVDKPHRNLTVTTTQVVDASRFAAKPPAPTAGATASADGKTAVAATPRPASSPVTSYTAQAGDTWADLSQAFYGSAQHWRRLADANQGGELTAGRQIVIPPKP